MEAWAKVRRELIGLSEPRLSKEYIGAIRSTLGEPSGFSIDHYVDRAVLAISSRPTGNTSALTIELDEARDRIRFWQAERARYVQSGSLDPNIELLAERDHRANRVAVMMQARELRAQEIRDLRAKVAVLEGRVLDVPAPTLPSTVFGVGGKQIEQEFAGPGKTFGDPK